MKQKLFYFLLTCSLGLSHSAHATSYLECFGEKDHSIRLTMGISDDGKIAKASYKNVSFEDVRVETNEDFKTQSFYLYRAQGREQFKMIIFWDLFLFRNSDNKNEYRALILTAVNAFGSSRPLLASNLDMICHKN